jgi:hypothetical protein
MLPEDLAWKRTNELATGDVIFNLGEIHLVLNVKPTTVRDCYVYALSLLVLDTSKSPATRVWYPLGETSWLVA